MAQFEPSKKTANDFNGGNEYINGDGTTTGDMINADDINNVIESTLYAQSSAESAVNTANAAKQTAQGALSQVNQVLADKTLLPDVQKNYYNLGAFDTFVSNGNGTGNVGRKTESIVVDGNNIKMVGKSGNYDGVFYGEVIPINRTLISDFSEPSMIKASVPVAAYAYLGNQGGIAIGLSSSNAISVGFPTSSNVTTVNEANKWLAANPIYVQYEGISTYQYIEPVIENQPIHRLNQVGENWLEDEFKKGLNLFDATKNIRNDYGAELTIVSNNSLIVKQGTHNYSRVVFSVNCEKGAVYHFSCTASAQTRVIIFDASENSILKDFDAINFDFTFVAPAKTYIYLYSANAATTTFNNIILTRGSVSYPYEPYSGDLVRNVEVPIYFTSQTYSPAQTIGGDWESLGSFTTSTNNTIYAWRRL